MAQVLRHLPAVPHADLLVGAETLDDAAVWRRPDGRALVATVDFFTPIVDDARTWGRIAAANAVSDVYAMGGRPLFALNLAAWPKERLPLELLGDVLAGGLEVATAGGWAVVGGHTIDGAEPTYGQAVVGEVAEDRLLRNSGGQAGHALVLTKALGTGLVATAVKRSEPEALSAGGWLAASYAAAVASMTRLNDDASRAALDAGASACTDVTGFGLLGHLHQLARASGVAAEVVASDVPLLPDARSLVEQGHVPGGTRRNLAHVRPWLDGEVDETTAVLLADAQTSGGLLFACPPEGASAAVQRLRDSGHAAAVVGRLVAGGPGRITVGSA